MDYKSSLVKKIEDALAINHEIEFEYNGVSYGLVDHPKGWQLATGRHVIAVSDDCYELFEAPLIEGKSMRVIIENRLYEMGTLIIL